MSTAKERRQKARKHGLNLHRSGPWIAVVGLLVNLWLTISSVLYAPWWGMVLLLSYLVPQTAMVKRWIPQRPADTIWIPVAGAVVWAITVYVGAQWWGWST